MLTIDPTTGYAFSAADLAFDELTECGANDPDYGPPERWPAWCDEWRWATDPPVTGAGLEPDQYEPTEQDWADYHAWCREQDRRNGWDTPPEEFPGVISPELARTLAYGNCH